MIVRWNDQINDTTAGEKIIESLADAISFQIGDEILGSNFLENCLKLISEKHSAFNSSFIGAHDSVEDACTTLGAVLNVSVVREIDSYPLLESSGRTIMNMVKTRTKNAGGQSTNKTMGGEISYTDSTDFENFIVDSPTSKAISRNDANSTESENESNPEYLNAISNYLKMNRPFFDFVSFKIQSILSDYTTLY